jgi:hypothetical protein
MIADRYGNINTIVIFPEQDAVRMIRPGRASLDI